MKNDSLTSSQQTTRAVSRFARLQLPGILAGVIAAVGIAIFGTGPAKLFLVPAVGVVAFVLFYLQAKRAAARGRRPRHVGDRKVANPKALTDEDSPL